MNEVTATTARMRSSFHLRSLDTIRFSEGLLFLLESGDRAARDVDLDAVGDAELDDVVGDPRDRSVDPAARDDPVAVLQRLEHRLHRLLLLARRSEHEEIEDDEDQPHRHNELEEEIGSLGGGG